MKTLDEILAKKMHDWYEEYAKVVGWDTQEKTKVPFEDLPEANKKVMLYVSNKILDWHKEEARKTWYYEGSELVITKGKWVIDRIKRQKLQKLKEQI